MLVFLLQLWERVSTSLECVVGLATHNEFKDGACEAVLRGGGLSPELAVLEVLFFHIRRLVCLLRIRYYTLSSPLHSQNIYLQTADWPKCSSCCDRVRGADPPMKTFSFLRRQLAWSDPLQGFIYCMLIRRRRIHKDLVQLRFIFCGNWNLREQNPSPTVSFQLAAQQIIFQDPYDATEKQIAVTGLWVKAYQRIEFLKGLFVATDTRVICLRR